MTVANSEQSHNFVPKLVRKKKHLVLCDRVTSRVMCGKNSNIEPYECHWIYLLHTPLWHGELSVNKQRNLLVVLSLPKSKESNDWGSSTFCRLNENLIRINTLFGWQFAQCLLLFFCLFLPNFRRRVSFPFENEC